MEGSRCGTDWSPPSLSDRLGVFGGDRTGVASVVAHPLTIDVIRTQEVLRDG
jgi:hypothetical protein